MASPKRMRNFRSWSSMDSEDPNDILRLYSPEPPPRKPSGKCVSTWTFSLVSLGFAVLFLIGLFVGYYVRESQSLVTEIRCNDLTERPDKLDPNKLKIVHENVMFYLSAERIQRLASELYGSTDYSSDSPWDQRVTKRLKADFSKNGLEKVEVKNYNVVVTYPDPRQPNRLEVITMETESTLMNISLESSDKSQKTRKEKTNRTATDGIKQKPDTPPFVAFSPGGVVEGSLVYGHYGRKIDLEIIKQKGIPIKGRILLLRLGKSTVHNKLMLANQEGVVGVLLYNDPRDVPNVDPLSVPSVSARGDDVGAKQIAVVAQTVSMVLAEQLLGNITGIESPPEWQGDLNTTYNIGNVNSGTWKVRLTVNNQKLQKTIRNVMGSLQGSMETDRYVIVGSSRNFFLQNQRNFSIGTVLLLELIHSINSIIELENWEPRRGIRFISWGGGELSNIGLAEYLKENHHLLQSKAVGFIDLDLYLTSDERTDMSSLEVRCNALLSELVSKVGLKVPDPVIPDQSVAEGWMGTVHYGYHDNSHVYTMIQSLGIPVVQAGYHTSNKIKKVSMVTDDDVEHDAAHHYKYHLTAARVMSLVVTSLLDGALLNHNVAHYTKFIYNVAKNTAQLLHSVNLYDLRDNLLSSAVKMEKTGKAFQHYATSVKVSHNPLKVRKLNDVKILVGKIFSSCAAQKWCSQQLVSDDGTWSAISEAVNLAKITGEWSDVTCQSQIFQMSLEEATEALRLN